MTRPDMPTTYEMTREVPDHEVLLVFNGDDDATDFRDWLDYAGWENFAQYQRKQGVNANREE